MRPRVSIPTLYFPGCNDRFPITPVFHLSENLLYLPCQTHLLDYVGNSLLERM